MVLLAVSILSRYSTLSCLFLVFCCCDASAEEDWQGRRCGTHRRCSVQGCDGKSKGWIQGREGSLWHRWLANHSPAGLFGNGSKKDTAMARWSISALIEQAWYVNERVAGGISDIIKCYNCLPRLPVFHLAKHMRVPNRLLQPWHHAISTMERRLVVNGGTGPSLRSTTGFPEGDPLSVTSMYLLTGAKPYV